MTIGALWFAIRVTAMIDGIRPITHYRKVAEILPTVSYPIAIPF
jgi:hypothetical protein